MANTNGFTLMDMVSYDRKHNEANGEDNRDGTDYNLSWNCGEEGPSRKKRVIRMRKQQLRNAMVLLFLSQGTPLIMAGDELAGPGKAITMPTARTTRYPGLTGAGLRHKQRWCMNSSGS